MSAWIVETLAATTILMVVVLLIREPVARRFGARTAYLLWLLPALRMMLPPLPESIGPAPIAQLPEFIDFSALSAMSAAAADSALPPVDTGIEWSTILPTLWLGGAALFMLWHLIAYRRFVTGALAQSIQLPEFDRDGVEVCASKAIDGPFATGIFLPTIVLPHDYRTRYTADELRLAMRHEWAHHNRGDLTVNLLALTMLALHWFNPLAHRAWRAFRADQELACDAIVLEGASSEERHSYGAALVKSACSRTPVAACSLNPRNQIKRRLEMMRASTERRVSGRALAASLVGGGLLLTASGGIASEATEQVKEQVRETVVAKAAAISAVADAVAAVPEAHQARVAARQATHASTDTEAAWDEAESAQEMADDARDAADEAHADAIADAREAAAELEVEIREARDERIAALKNLNVRIGPTWRHSAAVRVAVPVPPVPPGCRTETRSAGSAMDGDKAAATSTVVCKPLINAVDMRAHSIRVLRDVRANLARSDMHPDYLAKTLAGIDAELARLRKIKPETSW